MFAIETFAEAVCAHEYKRAVGIAEAMTDHLKTVAREIWNRWVSTAAPF